ncbi:MAG: hypothetical protein GEU77_06885 [Deltaproteobacteria bacterium]|nr:hypothetical protein [Deltaproteobacteria bacterium]
MRGGSPGDFFLLRADSLRGCAGTSPPIRHNGPRFLPTTLEIKLRPQVGRSNNAGDYVCNYSMYVILDNIGRKALEVKFGFIHIPHDSNPHKATEIVAGAIKQVSLDR